MKGGRTMKYLRQLAIILSISFMGEVINRLFNAPIPGNVIGMLILLICLLTGVIKTEMIEETVNFLLDHLAFLFLPAGVGLIACLDILKSNWVAILTIVFISTIVVMVSTGLAVQMLMRRRCK
jgi:holin-like protein